MSQAKKTLLVAAIENGTVIDHIPAGQAFQIIESLKLKEDGHAVTLGLNLESKRLGKKDILKIEGRFLSELEAGEIAVFAPGAGINIIRDFAVTEKMTAALPQALHKILVCPNSYCVSRCTSVSSHFHIHAARSEIHLICHYCEKVYSRSDIQEYYT